MKRTVHVVALGVAVALAPLHAHAGSERAACAAASEEGQKLRDEGKLLKAHQQFLTCARDVCPATIKKDCADWLEKVETSTPTIVFSAKDTNGHDVATAKVSVDGAPLTTTLDGKAVSVDPGVHTFRIEIPGEKPMDQQIVVREGEKNRAVPVSWDRTEGQPTRVALIGEPTPIETKTSHVPAFVIGGLAIAALGVGTTFAIVGSSGYGDLKNGCGMTTTCTSSQVSPVKTELLVGDITIGIGLAALAAAVILFVTEAPSKPHAHPLGFSPGPGGTLRFGATF